jgi:hypothetical protein
MLLHEVAEGNNNDGINYLCNSGVKMHQVYHYFQVQVVQTHTGHGRAKIAHQLVAAPQGAGGKNHISCQVKPNGKGAQEGRYHGCNMRRKRNHGQMHQLLLKYKIITDKKYKQAEQGIASAACCIPERLLWHKAPEQGVKKI